MAEADCHSGGEGGGERGVDREGPWGICQVRTMVSCVVLGFYEERRVFE